MKIQSKMFIFIVIFLIIPFLVFGLMYYRILIDTTKDNLDQSTYELLEQMDRNIQLKTNRLKTKTDVLLFDRQFQEILRKSDFEDRNSETFDAITHLDNVMEQYFYDESELESIIAFIQSGGVYTYKGTRREENLVTFMTKYGKVEPVPGNIQWFGISGENDIFKPFSTLAAGVTLTDTVFQKDDEKLATLYFLYGADFFDSISAKTVEDNESLIIYMPEGEQIYSRGVQNETQLWKISIDIARQIHKGKQGSIKLELNGEDSILVYYTSPNLGWKYVKIIKYSEYFKKAEDMKVLTVVAAVLLFVLLCLINALWLRHMTRPVKKIVAGMNEVGKRNFDVNISVDSKDEFGIIANGFNSMVGEIKSLFRQVVDEEQKSKEAELSALQYQINPHFLYNTLNAIRLTSLFNGQHDVAEMLSILGNFLHNTLSNIDKKVSLEEEFNNIRDYISLYQIRFNNQIVSDFSLSDELKDCAIHSMLIQPLVENAIMHGLSQKLDSGETAIVRISAQEKEGELHVAIWDNGVGITEGEEKVKPTDDLFKKKGLHIGHSNIRKRIKYLYGDEYGLEIKSVPSEFTEVTLILPIITNGENT